MTALPRRHGAEGKERHGRRQEDRVRQGLVRCHARHCRRHDEEGGRAGQGPDHDRPASGDERRRYVKNYAKTKPDITFINGPRARRRRRSLTRRRTFHRFNTEGAQWMPKFWASTRSPRATRRSSSSRRTTASRTRRCRASWPLLRQGRQGGRQGLGAARHQGLRGGGRQDPEGHRRRARGPRWPGRRQLPQSARGAGWRQQSR